MRGATRFSVFLAYVSVILRFVQVVGIILQKEQMSQICYGVSTFFIILMFFTDFAKENADIIHEAQPKEDVVDAMIDLMNNYQPSPANVTQGGN